MAKPYPQGVTSDYSRLDTGLLRDLIALLLVLAGVVGLTTAAFATDWRLGLAVLSVDAMAAGVYLGYER